MKRVLLVGRDPVFAWVLQRFSVELGFHLEHVFTLSEAQIRRKRNNYDAFFLDGLRKNEIQVFCSESHPEDRVVIFDEAIGAATKQCSTYYLPKEQSLHVTLDSLRGLL